MFETPTGVTRALHASDFGARVRDDESKWRWTVMLASSPQFESRRVGDSTLSLSFDIASHLKEVVEAISEFVAIDSLPAE
jgi:hypothetical protein